jgi:hypothetical protein
MSRKRVRNFFLKLAVLTGLLVCLYLVVFNLAGMLAPADSALAAMTVSATWTSPTPIPTAEPTPEPTPAPTELPAFQPQGGDTEQITGTAIMVHGEEADSYAAPVAETIDFGAADDYTDVKGIVTFRGNNFRNTAQYGLAQLSTKSFGDYWCKSTSGQSDSSGNYWGGSGWTGQPLVVEWPAETKAVMNMYDWAKEKEGLVEVIYATMGGYVYFYDLDTGEYTRDPLYLGYTFKGAGALDPRGYPILYVGGGVTNPSGDTPRIMVVSLIDGEVLYTTGNSDSFAPRYWSAWDSSPLVDAETDQLVYPGENGVLYLIKLNSRYDEATGALSVEPEEVKFTYSSSSADQYLYGMEDSAIAWRGHLFIADNGGDFLCINLNTLTVEWCFNCLDDTNCTGVLEVDDTGHPYIYLSTSFHMGWRSYSTATIPVWKIDAVTGEEVWSHEYSCYSESGLSGGVQGSLSLGTGSLEGILYVAMAREPNAANGQLLALDTETGEELWTFTSDSYSWSTPTCFYDTKGNGYVLYTSCINGKMYMVDGLTGEVYDTFSFGCTMEASPVVYNNTVVIGTRSEQVYGITLE